MKNTVKSSLTSPLFLMGMLVGSVILLMLVTIVLFYSENSLKLYEKISLVSATISIFIALVSILFTKLSLEQNRKQWLNEAFIKNEAEVLLKFRKLLHQNIMALSLYRDVLFPLKYAFEPDNPPFLPRAKVVESYNQLVELNDFYNTHQYIFRKHNLDQKFFLINALLQITSLLPIKDLTYTKIGTEGDINIYALLNRPEIVSMFNNASIFMQRMPTNGENFTIEELNSYLLEDQDALCESFFNSITTNLHELERQLDFLTLFTEDASKEWSKKSYFYKKLDQ